MSISADACTRFCRFRLACIYDDESKWEEAWLLYEVAAHGRAQVLGSAHEDTLHAYDRLALLLDDIGENVRARELYVKFSVP